MQMNSEALDLCCAYGWPGQVGELRDAVENACAACPGRTIQATHLPAVLRQLSKQTIVNTPTDSQATSSFLFALGASTDARPSEPRVLESTQRIVPLKSFLRDQEVAYLQRALIQADGSKEKAAEMLGVSLATIYRKLSEENDNASDSADACRRLSSSLEEPAIV
jgi:DNA-binding NtrC family response regulator